MAPACSTHRLETLTNRRRTGKNDIVSYARSDIVSAFAIL